MQIKNDTAAVRSRRSTGHFVAAAISLTAILSAAGGADAAPPVRSTEGPWAKGRILVMPKPGLPAEQIAKLFRGSKVSKIGGSNLHIVELPPQASEKAIAAQLANNPHLDFAELDRAVDLTGTANDPYFGSAWHLLRINAPTAWDGSQGSGITIAVVDTGVDASHPDLSARIVPGWNFYDNNANTADVNGHGTGIAGAAAAATNNGMGVSSVAGQAKIMPIRIADPTGSAYWSTIAEGITWAADKGARVINISYDQLPLSSAVITASNYAKGKGALVIVAAGNRAKDEQFAPTESMIPVSAADRSDRITTWSSWGSYVALSAPGVDIWSTTRGGSYGAWWGTSVASPVTAGVVALMMAANSKLNNAEIEKLLFSTSVDLGDSGRDKYYGHGRVNAAAAVQAALAATSNVDTQAPSASISAPLGSTTVSGLVGVDVSAVDDVGVTKVELRANGSAYATDSSAPFAFIWDSTRVSNGMVNLEAFAYDAAGNAATSLPVAVNVANKNTIDVSPNDTTPPSVRVTNPVANARVSGTVSINVTAADNSGSAGIRQALYIDGRLVKSAIGESLSYRWNTRKISAGSHSITATAIDAAGNSSSESVSVSR